VTFDRRVRVHARVVGVYAEDLHHNRIRTLYNIMLDGLSKNGPKRPAANSCSHSLGTLDSFIHHQPFVLRPAIKGVRKTLILIRLQAL
jgi:hypothetical protein